MSFLKNIGKSLTNFGQDVANQSKNMSENAKLKAAITLEEKKMDELYRVLGKTHADRCINAAKNPEMPFNSKSCGELFAMDMGVVEQILSCREKIEKLNMALAQDQEE